MNEDSTATEAPTRREYVKYGGAVIGGGLLAGCTGGESRANDGGETTESTDEATVAETDASYEACIVPVGCLTFESVPKTWLCRDGLWADMAFALGQRDGFLTANLMPPAFFFEEVGIAVPTELQSLWSRGWDKEIFYELDPDVILMDPNFMHGVGWDDSWDQSDTEEIRENVAPFFGNNILRRREFHDYKLYTLYEAFDRLADLFQERERYEAFVELHQEVQTEIRSRLPPENERPEVGLINGGSEPGKGKFYPMDTRGEGVEMKPYRDLDIESAFPDSMEGGAADYERLLEVDPEIIIVHWAIGMTGDTGRFSAAAFREQYVTPMEEDAVGSQLTAVQNGNVYPGAFGSQGPIVNLFQTEMVAQQLYPEEFGQFDPERFPEVPEENRLFDRKRVVDVINGDV